MRGSGQGCGSGKAGGWGGSGGVARAKAVKPTTSSGTTPRQAARRSAIGFEGRVDYGAVGTVTTVEGRNVLAFGHEVFGDARVKYLMHGAYVLGFVNSSTVPFKLAEAVGNSIGLFSTDRPYGLGGATGTVTPLPLEVTVKRGKDTATTRVNLAPVEDFAGRLDWRPRCPRWTTHWKSTPLAVRV
ncbi:MAG: hypothetical protein HC933_06950 [Pleurocapsa sp. SU_196_0]|nr:hypothetical protein [Pleurocapsa sp. SU_196_0]